jgi:hypothetical protein
MAVPEAQEAPPSISLVASIPSTTILIDGKSPKPGFEVFVSLKDEPSKKKKVIRSYK